LILPLLVLGCSAGGEPEGPPSATNGGGNGSGGRQTVETGTGGADIIAPLPEFTEEDCDNILPVMYRDFSSSHPDFERTDTSGDEVRRQLVAPAIGTDRKPVFLGATGCPWEPTTPLGCVDYNWLTVTSLTTAENFDQWYRNVDGVNHPFEKELVLTEDPPGSGTYVYDDQSFFPLDASEGFGESFQAAGVNQNFHFTTEVHLQFTYLAGQKFSFYGDDDLWIFINGKLALDLGGMHRKAEGTIDFDAQAGDLGISPNGHYAMDIFHAERHTAESTFRIETNISCFVPVEIY
jgi:fibro-slime domain-containing protein